MTGVSSISFPARAALWLAVLAGALAPVFSAPVPPGGDYAGHLARVHVIHHLADDPHLGRYYAVEWSVLPNLAFDVVTWPLMKVMDAYDAARVFVCMAILALFASVSVLRRQLLGRAGLAPLWAVLVVYSAPAAGGLANFYLGQSVLLLALAAWLATAGWR